MSGPQLEIRVGNRPLPYLIIHYFGVHAVEVGAGCTSGESMRGYRSLTVASKGLTAHIHHTYTQNLHLL